MLHRGPQAIYLDLEGRALGVLAASAVQVPCAVSTRLSVLPEVRSARVEGGTLHLDDVPLRIGRITDPRVPTLARGRLGGLRAGVARLLGAGDGLTPYGDDVLCGWLAVHRAAGRGTPAADVEIRDGLHRTTGLSAALLDCAMHGEVIPEFAAYVGALGTDREAAAADAVRRVGHTSGAGLLEGAGWALAA